MNFIEKRALTEKHARDLRNLAQLTADYLPLANSFTPRSSRRLRLRRAIT